MWAMTPEPVNSWDMSIIVEGSLLIDLRAAGLDQLVGHHVVVGDGDRGATSDSDAQRSLEGAAVGRPRVAASHLVADEDSRAAREADAVVVPTAIAAPKVINSRRVRFMARLLSFVG